jgi:hypothetical protein
VPTLEGVGAALASTLSYLTMTVVLLVFFRRATGIERLRELVPRKAELVDYRILAGSAVRRIRRKDSVTRAPETLEERPPRARRAP